MYCCWCQTPHRCFQFHTVDSAYPFNWLDTGSLTDWFYDGRRRGLKRQLVLTRDSLICLVSLFFRIRKSHSPTSDWSSSCSFTWNSFVPQGFPQSSSYQVSFHPALGKDSCFPLKVVLLRDGLTLSYLLWVEKNNWMWYCNMVKMSCKWGGVACLHSLFTSTLKHWHKVMGGCNFQ